MATTYSASYNNKMNLKQINMKPYNLQCYSSCMLPYFAESVRRTFVLRSA